MMSQPESISYESVIRAVRQWPAAERFSLMQDVLRTLATEAESKRPRRQTLEQALGLLASDSPAPTDEEVRGWLDEHRMEKYG